MTVNAPKASKRLIKYLLGQGNVAEGFVTDSCGRFLSVFDEVFFGMCTDEGIEVGAIGTIISITGVHAVIHVKGYEFAGVLHITDRCGEILRLPPWGKVQLELKRCFNEINRSLLNTQKLHVNGKQLCFLN